MKETGEVVEVIDNKVKIRMYRNTACGDCGACQVTPDQMRLTLEAENTLGAKPGDIVEVDMETVDFLSAVIIVYLYPLIALVVGILGGYYGFKALGFSDEAAQGIGAVLGIGAAAITYLIIRNREDKRKGLKKYRPVMSNIIDRG